MQNHRPLLKVLFALPCQAIDAARGAAFAGQAVDIKEVHDGIWLVSFMDHDLGYFDMENEVLEPLDNSFGPKLSPL